MTDEEKRLEGSEAAAEGKESEGSALADKPEEDGAADVEGSDDTLTSRAPSDEGDDSVAAKSAKAESEESDGEKSASGASPGTEEPEESPSEQVEAAPKSDHGHGGPVHGDHGHGGHDDHLGHTAPMSLLIGVLLALSLLTILTVAVTAIDLGGQGNFIVAMVIATVKAILVMGYFMHMFWDAKFNVVAFTSSFLFLLLFLGMTLLDRGEYQSSIDKFEVDQKLQAR